MARRGEYSSRDQDARPAPVMDQRARPVRPESYGPYDQDEAEVRAHPRPLLPHTDADAPADPLTNSGTQIKGPAVPAEALRAEGPRRGRDTAIVASGTFLARILAFFKTITVLAVLGSNGLGDAYNLASTIPALIYDLVLGGILGATMVPVFVDQFRRKDQAAAMRSISAVLTTVFSLLLVVAILVYFFAPQVIHFYLLSEPRTEVSADKQALGGALLRLFAPQVVFLGAVVVTGALLNAKRDFVAPAVSPAVNNVILIGALWATKLVAQNMQLGPFRHDHSAILVLGLGTSLGYFVQFLMHLPGLAKAGIRFRPRFDFKDPAVRRIARLSGWLGGVVLCNQAAFTVLTEIANRRPGDYTIFQAGYLFFQLPFSLFAVSIATVLTPDLAERWAEADLVGYRNRFLAGLRTTLAILMPVGIGYALVAQPVVLLAARHGATSATSAHLIGATLALFAIGLPGFSAFIFLMRGLQAMQDTRGMFVAYLLQLPIQIGAAFALYPALGVKGLALAWDGPALIAACIGVGQLYPRIHSFGGWPTIWVILRIAISTAIMAVAILGVGWVLPDGTADLPLLQKLVAQTVIGAAVYVFAARTSGIRELDPILAMFRRLAARLPGGGTLGGLFAGSEGRDNGGGVAER